ncbi:MAG: hypothetical protein R3201_00130 [Oceanisphaera sp.]|nr:hypothetical protein [Oceanisphaera sp.]
MICNASPCKAAALLVDIDVNELRRLLDEWRDFSASKTRGGWEEAMWHADSIAIELDHSGLLDIIERIQAGYSE